MNIGLPEAQIAALCEKAGVRISDIETLPRAARIWCALPAKAPRRSAAA
jgi:hypothetical protein